MRRSANARHVPPQVVDPHREHQRAGRWLFLHFFLVTLPCVVAGGIGALILLFAVGHGGSLPAIFVLGLAVWGLASAIAPFIVGRLASIRQRQGAAGLAAVVGTWWAGLWWILAAQAVTAVVMVRIAFPGDGLFTLLPCLAAGAPWLSLAWHLRHLRDA